MVNAGHEPKTESELQVGFLCAFHCKASAINALLSFLCWGFPKIRGTLFWGPYHEDPTIQGTILGSPFLGNSQLGVEDVRELGNRGISLGGLFGCAPWRQS